MTGTWTRAAAATIVLLTVPALAGAQAGPDAGLAKGIEQVQNGALAEAVETLNGVVRRLSPVGTRSEDVAQAHLWLGIAYAQQGSEKSSRTSFREALKLDPRVSLAEGWPPKVSRLFAEVKAEASASVSAQGTAPPGDALSPGEKAVQEKARFLTDGLQLDEAEALFRDWMDRNPKSVRACGWLAEFLFTSFHERPPRVEEGMAVVDRCLTLEPRNATARQIFANALWEKARGAGTDEQKDRYADLGLKYTNQALKINPNLVDSMVMKGLFLRVKAMSAKDDKTRNAYLAEASLLADDAKALRTSGKGEFSGASLPAPGPPPTLPPSAGAPPTLPPSAGPPPALGAVRVGGQIPEPRKTKHVDFAYPEVAKSARVQGVVIMECTISPEGKVIDVRVLRGIPLLDAAAIEAVKQWEYTPTLLNGVPVPVIMTVTANFRLS